MNFQNCCCSPVIVTAAVIAIPITSSPELSSPSLYVPPIWSHLSDFPNSQLLISSHCTLWNHSPLRKISASSNTANGFFFQMVLMKIWLSVSTPLFLVPSSGLFSFPYILYHQTQRWRMMASPTSLSHQHIVPPSSTNALLWSSDIRLYQQTIVALFYGHIAFFRVTLPRLLKILSPCALLPSAGITFGDFNINVNYSSDTLTSQLINLFSTFLQLSLSCSTVALSLPISASHPWSSIPFFDHLLPFGIPIPKTLRPHIIHSPVNHSPFNIPHPFSVLVSLLT